MARTFAELEVGARFHYSGYSWLKLAASAAVCDILAVVYEFRPFDFVVPA